MKKTRKLLAIFLSVLVVMTGVPALSFAIEDFSLATSITSEEIIQVPSQAPEAPEGYEFVEFSGYDENGIAVYHFEEIQAQGGIIHEKWLNALGDEVQDPNTESAYPHWNDYDRAGNYDSYYDAREDGIESPVEEQIGGTCWAHAATACLEANYIKRGYGTKETVPNISEYHIVWYSRNGYDPESSHGANDAMLYYYQDNLINIIEEGGNTSYVSIALSNYTGGADETPFAFDGMEKEELLSAMQSSFNFDTRYRQDIVLDSIKSLDYDMDQIKQAVLDYGAVYISYYSKHDTNYYNTYYYYVPEDTPLAYYYPEEKTTNHAVTLIGWDDNFSKENFNSLNQPEGDGAWLIKNSWGTDWGNEGYFWISYYDKTLAHPYVVTALDPENFDNVYLYDGKGASTSFSSGAYSNVFVAENDEYLTFINNPKQDYTLKVYTGLPETVTDPTAGNLVYTQSGAKCSDTYIPITGEVKLSKGEKFSIVIEGTKAYYETTSNTQDNLTYNEGESFYLSSDGQWLDSVENGYKNMSIRAFTKDIEEKESYRVTFIDNNEVIAEVYSENGKVTLPEKEGYTYIFTYGDKVFDGTGVNSDMSIQTHCFFTKGERKDETPCTIDYDCIYCGEDMQDSVTQHNYQTQTVEASATQIGHTAHICSVCGDRYYTDRAFYSGANKSGIDGDMWWQFCDGTLVINGIGATPDYDSVYATPWTSFFYEINKVYVSNGITVIGDYLFASLTALREIYLPDSVETISKYSLNATGRLTDIKLPENLKSIETYAFAGCALTQINWNSKLESIDDYAFYKCSGLQEITVPAGVDMGSYPFYDCANLKKVTIEEGVTYVDYIFSNADCVDEVIIPSTLTDGFFVSFTNVLRFTVNSGNKYFKDIDGVLYNKKGTTLVRYPTAKSDIYYKVPSSVTELGQYSFAYAVYLKYLDLSECPATGLGYNMFWENDSITNINLPVTMTTFKSNAFTGREIPKMFIPSTVNTFNSSSEINVTDNSVIYTDSSTALAKSWAESNGMSCVTDHTSHNYNTVAEIISDGNCILGAKVIKTCECGQFIYEVTDPTGIHTPSDNGIVTEPTCTTDGYTTYLCSVCNSEYTSDIVAAKGHSYKWITAKEATCISDGSKYEKCENCSATRNENTVVPATENHSYTAQTVKDEAFVKDATCESAKTYYYSCSVCGKVENNSGHTFTVGTALGHSYKWLVDKEATCGKTGLKHEECETCLAKKNENTVIAATGNHSFSSWKEISAATCTKEGKLQRECSVCAAKETKSISKIDHNYTQAATVAATCTSEGYTLMKCNLCGSTEKTNIVKATNHSDGNSDNVCDKCGENLGQKDCDHMCHKGGFSGFIWKIVLIFCKLFKTSAKCTCGAAHY